MSDRISLWSGKRRSGWASLFQTSLLSAVTMKSPLLPGTFSTLASGCAVAMAAAKLAAFGK